MKIELAKHSGFCFGVKNAIVRVVEEINTSDDPIHVYGPLIHNPQTVSILESRGLKTIYSLDDIDGRQVAVRTHGIPIEENSEIKKRAKRMLNLTCPKVGRVQAIIKKHSSMGCHTIILGDEDHAEVVGLKSFASAGVSVISSVDEQMNIPDADRYLLVSQTTLDRELFDKIVNVLSGRLKNLTIMDTICDSTRNRQEDVHDGIKKGIDTLIVVGGKNSANTTRLAEIGREYGIRTFHIETEEELVYDELLESKHILVTAGASTPGWIINNVLERLYDIKYRKSNFLMKAGKILLEFFVRTNSLSATFAFFVTWFLKSTRGYPSDFSLPLISMLYIFSMYSTNNYLDRDFLKASNSHKYGIYRKYGNALMLISLGMLAASFYLILDYSIITKLLLVSSYIFGFIYFTPPVKHFIDALKIPFIKNFYSSKIVTSLGWLTVVVIVPSLQFGLNPVLAFFILTLVLCIITIRHLLLGSVAYQGDFIFGRISLPIWLGQRRTTHLCYFFSILTILACLAATFTGDNRLLPILTIPVFYYLVLLRVVSKIEYPISLRYEILIDLNFIISILTFLIVI